MTERLVRSASMIIGIPAAPKAVVTVSAMSVATAARMGSNPSARRIPMGIATETLKPAAPSRKPPKHQEMRRIWMRRSSVTAERLFSITVMAPVRSITL